MTYKHQDMRGTMFVNTYKKAGDNKPDLKGQFNLGGKLWDIAGWKGETAKGDEKVSLTVSDPADRPQRHTSEYIEEHQESRVQQQLDTESDIPF